MRFAFNFSPSHGPLRFVSSHSRFTRVSRSPLRKKRTSNNANIDCRSPFPTCRAEREENSRKQKPLLYCLTTTEYTSKNATAATSHKPQSRLVVDYNRTQDKVILPILNCCLVPLKYIYISLLVFKTSQLSKPKTDSLKIIFAYREVIAWNELPNHVRDIETLNRFKRT